MDIPQTVMFNGTEYRLMGAGRYYLSQSTTNEGRRHAKGLHVAIWEFYSGKTVPQGYEIHHKDGNVFNNSFENLECVPRAEHRKITNYKTERVKKHLDSIRDLAADWHRSEEGREWHRKHVAESIGKIEPRECTCIQCGKKFMAKNRNAKFCSGNCCQKYGYRNKAAEEVRVCEVCGRTFSTFGGAYRKSRRTCSNSCRAKLGHKTPSVQPDG